MLLIPVAPFKWAGRLPDRSVWTSNQVTPGRCWTREISPLMYQRACVGHWRSHTTGQWSTMVCIQTTHRASQPHSWPPRPVPSRVPESQGLGWGPGMNMFNKCWRLFSLKFENYCTCVLEPLLASKPQGQFLWNRKVCHRNPTQCQLGNCKIYFHKATHSCLEWISSRAHSKYGQYAQNCNRQEVVYTGNELQKALQVLGIAVCFWKCPKGATSERKFSFFSLLSHTCI